MINKSGAWYAYEGNKIGQGRENAKLFLKEHPDICDEIEHKVRVHYNLIPGESEDTQEDKNDKKSDKSSGKTVKSDKAEDTAGAVSTQNADAGTKTEEV